MTKCIILGAGASHGYDDTISTRLLRPPLTNRFFDNAHELNLFGKPYRCLPNKWKSYKEKMVNPDNVDIEDFMEELIENFNKEKDQTQREFQIAISEMYYLVFDVLMYYQNCYNKPNNNYEQLASYHNKEKYSVISTNYDVLFEYAIHKVGLSYRYDDEDASQESIPIAKIHGSINWLNETGKAVNPIGNPATFEKAFQSVTGILYSNSFLNSPGVEKIRLERFLEKFKRLKDLFIHGSNGWDYYTPVIMPPLGNRKNFKEYEVYEPVWKFAESLLIRASELVLIGTQLRKKDEKLHNLIRDNFKGNKITIVNPYHEELRETLQREIFHSEEIQIERPPYTSFTDYIKSL